MLPSSSDASGFMVFKFPWTGTGSHCQSFPRWRFEPCNFQRVHGLSSCTEEPSLDASPELDHQIRGDRRVPLVHHGQTIGPTGPTCRLSHANSTSQPQPAQNHGHCCSLSDVGEICMTLHKQCHNAKWFLSQNSKDAGSNTRAIQFARAAAQWTRSNHEA